MLTTGRLPALAAPASSCSKAAGVSATAACNRPPGAEVPRRPHPNTSPNSGRRGTSAIVIYSSLADCGSQNWNGAGTALVPGRGVEFGADLTAVGVVEFVEDAQG